MPDLHLHVDPLDIDGSLLGLAHTSLAPALSHTSVYNLLVKTGEVSFDWKLARIDCARLTDKSARKQSSGHLQLSPVWLPNQWETKECRKNLKFRKLTTFS